MKKGSWVEVTGLKLEQFLHLNGKVGKVIEEGERHVVELGGVGRVPLLPRNLRTHPASGCLDRKHGLAEDSTDERCCVLCTKRKNVMLKCGSCDLVFCRECGGVGDSDHQFMPGVLAAEVDDGETKEKNEYLVRLVAKMKRKLETQREELAEYKTRHTGLIEQNEILKTQLEISTVKLKERDRDVARLEGLYNATQQALSALRDDDNEDEDSPQQDGEDLPTMRTNAAAALRQKVKELSDIIKAKDAKIDCLKRDSFTRTTKPTPNKSKPLRPTLVEIYERTQDIQCDPAVAEFLRRHSTGSRLFASKVDLVLSLARSVIKDYDGCREAVTRQSTRDTATTSNVKASKRSVSAEQLRAKQRLPSPAPRHRSRSPADARGRPTVKLNYSMFSPSQGSSRGSRHRTPSAPPFR